MPQRISVFGLGYVGSVTAACLAHRGHQVIGVDINQAKVDLLSAGKPTVLEKSLPDLTANAHRDGRLQATTDAARAIDQSDLSYICVGTPPLGSGDHDLSQLNHVLGEIGAALRSKRDYHTVVIRSTVLPGSTEKNLIRRLDSASGKREGQDFGICYNPEFLRESSAVADLDEPTITVFGASAAPALRATRQVYDWVPGRVFETSLRSAEAVKSICNAFHALKIPFANECGP